MIVYQMAYLFTTEDAHESFDYDRVPGIPTETNSMPELHSPDPNAKSTVIQARDIYEVVREAREFPESIHCIELGLSPYPHLDVSQKSHLNVSHVDVGPILQQVVETILAYNNIHLLFSSGWDMYSSRVYSTAGGDDDSGIGSKLRYDRTKQLQLQLKDLPNSRLHFWLGNTTEMSEHQSVFPEADVQYYSVYPIRMCRQHIEKKIPLFVSPNKNTPREKLFVCLNNYNKAHRTEMVRFIKSYEHNGNYLRHKTYFSYLRPGEKELTCLADGQHEQDQIGDWQDIIDVNIVNNCYSYIATETHWSNAFNFGFSMERPIKHNNPLFNTSISDKELNDFQVPMSGWISEKSLKSAYYELPLLVVGYAGCLQAFRDIGFKTFPEFYDERYDSVGHDGERMRQIQQNIIRLLKMPIEEVHDLYHSDNVQSKLKHNKELFINMVRHDPYLSLFVNTDTNSSIQEFCNSTYK